MKNFKYEWTLVQTNSLQHEHEQLIYRQDQRNHIACKELMSNVHFKTFSAYPIYEMIWEYCKEKNLNKESYLMRQIKFKFFFKCVTAVINWQCACEITLKSTIKIS